MFIEHSMDEIYERVFAAIHEVVPIGMVLRRSMDGGQMISEQMIVPDVGVISKLVKMDFGHFRSLMDGDQYYMYSRCGGYYVLLQPCRVTDSSTGELLDTKAVFFGYVGANSSGQYQGSCMWSAYNSHELTDGLRQTRIEIAHAK